MEGPEANAIFQIPQTALELEAVKLLIRNSAFKFVNGHHIKQIFEQVSPK